MLTFLTLYNIYWVIFTFFLNLTIWPIGLWKLMRYKIVMCGATTIKLKKGSYGSCDVEASMGLDFFPQKN